MTFVDPDADDSPEIRSARPSSTVDSELDLRSLALAPRGDPSHTRFLLDELRRIRAAVHADGVQGRKQRRARGDDACGLLGRRRAVRHARRDRVPRSPGHRARDGRALVRAARPADRRRPRRPAPRDRRPPAVRARPGARRARRGRPGGRLHARPACTRAARTARGTVGPSRRPRRHVRGVGAAARNASRPARLDRRRARPRGQRPRLQHDPGSRERSARARDRRRKGGGASSARARPWTSSPGSRGRLTAGKSCWRARGRHCEDAPTNPAVVRRYRLQPDPLVRDTARGYRTGRVERVLAGDFDLF